MYTQVEWQPSFDHWQCQEKAAWEPGNKANLSIDDWHNCAAWSCRRSCSVRLVVYESDTSSENAAYHMQVSSTSSRWGKCIFHNLGACILCNAGSN